jgi:3-deoxy-7-phosphoheptulonate synthase
VNSYQILTSETKNLCLKYNDQFKQSLSERVVMFFILQSNATEQQVDNLMARIRSCEFSAQKIIGEDRVCIAVTGVRSPDDLVSLGRMPGVSRLVPVSPSYRLASREAHPENTIVQVGDICFGDGSLTIIGGPCAVESEQSTLRIAMAVAERGCKVLRGGAYKPRSSPYSFQGLGEPGLEILAKAGEQTGLPVVTEVLCVGTADLVAGYVDMLQVGTRNMQNFALLKEVARQGKPVILKRGMCATLDEWLMSAEYLLTNGCKDVVLCERGIRTFNTHSRNTLDVSIIPAIKQASHLPIIVDPSHASGSSSQVIPHALAGIGAGCDGLMVDVHDRPEEALCDGPQALLPEQFGELIDRVRAVGLALGKPLS